ncbi:MAG: hemolysin family protein [Planctomycetota bacterium]|jgi:CBS domain containing-hemolysin-like protein
MGLLIFYLVVALGVSFLCSLVEAGILSLPRSHVAMLAKDKRSSGRILEGMKQNIDRPLAAILTLNTIAHTVGAAGVGAQALVKFGSEWVAVVSAILTILILVFSEIIPKTLGVVYTTKLAGINAYIIKGMIILTYPLVVLFQGLSRLLSSRVRHTRLTRKEVALIAELGQAEGALQEKEYQVIRNLLRLNNIRVKKIMTPRNVVFMLAKDMTVKEAADQHSPLRFSRIPVYATGPDDIVGIVLRPEIYDKVRGQANQCKLEQIVQPIHAVPETAAVGQVLNELVQRRDHIFLVVDEYGGTAGIVTLEDAIETLLGVEIVDETDVVTDMRRLTGKLLQSKLRR